MGFHRWRTASRRWLRLKPRVRELRESGTTAEARLWEHLRGRRLNGLKFRRQHAIGGYVVDFFCPDASLVVEVDGPVHDGMLAEDKERDRVLAAHGLTVLRMRNDEIQRDLELVLSRIAAAADRRGTATES